MSKHVVKLQPNSLVKRLGVDFVFTPSQSQWQSEPYQKRVLAGIGIGMQPYFNPTRWNRKFMI